MPVTARCERPCGAASRACQQRAAAPGVRCLGPLLMPHLIFAMRCRTSGKSVPEPTVKTHTPQPAYSRATQYTAMPTCTAKAVKRALTAIGEVEARWMQDCTTRAPSST